MAETRKQNTPDPAVGWINTYEDKKTGEEVKYLRVRLNSDILSGLDIVDGSIYLSGFFITDKKSEKSPDVVFKSSSKSTKGGTASAGATKKAALPF